MTPNPRVSKYSDSADERSMTLVSLLTLPTHRQTPSLTSTPGRSPSSLARSLPWRTFPFEHRVARRCEQEGAAACIRMLAAAQTAPLLHADITLAGAFVQ